MRQPAIVQRLRRRLGVRMRSALAAGLVVAVVSVLAGCVLLVTARGILIDNVTTAGNERAGQVAAVVAGGDATALATVLRPSARDRAVVQVLDSSGRVVAASEAVAGLPTLSRLRPAAGVRDREKVDRDEG